VRTVRLAPGAIADIRRILQRSAPEFGPGEGSRYKVLLDQALQDLVEDPRRVGVGPVPDVRPGYFVYRVKFSRPRVTGRLVVFSVDASDAVLVAAVVHEREMLERHLEN